MSNDAIWLNATLKVLHGYRKMIDACVLQLSDQQLVQKPAPNVNSVSVLLRHLGGNLKSRWTNFLTEDGEKPDRNRDFEFRDWEGDRQSLIGYFDEGWQCLIGSIESLQTGDMSKQVAIRGEQHTVPEAIQRSISHLSYHVGQIMMVARSVHGDEGWQWLTIAPNTSEQFNSANWGTSASRGIAGSGQ